MQIEPLWRDFHDRLHAFMLKQTSDQDLSEDLTQEVFVRIHSNLGNLRKKNSLDKWIYRIARNVLADHFRQQKHDLDVDYSPRELPQEEQNLTAEKRLAESLRGMILELPQKYRDALWASDIEGIPQVKLAETLGISFSGAKSRVQRARKMLRDLLMKCCHFEFDQRGEVIDYHPISCCCCENNTPHKIC